MTLSLSSQGRTLPNQGSLLSRESVDSTQWVFRVHPMDGFETFSHRFITGQDRGSTDALSLRRLLSQSVPLPLQSLLILLISKNVKMSFSLLCDHLPSSATSCAPVTLIYSNDEKCQPIEIWRGPWVASPSALKSQRISTL